MRARRLAALTAILATVASAPAAAGQKGKPAPDTYDAMLARYLDEARKLDTPSPDAMSWGWMNNLALDHRARQANDIVTIRVEESITATNSADSSVSKTSNGNLGFASLFGLEKHLPGSVDPAALVGAKRDTQFKGGGSTTRAGELTATLSARVAEVLPNGDLVIEGVREIEINGERQVVVLTGIARPTDIDPHNVVSSMTMAQVRIRYFGRGLIKDSLSPGFLIRFLNKVF
jgi:flagellar L-ring protein precursor FlgH